MHRQILCCTQTRGLLGIMLLPFGLPTGRCHVFCSHENDFIIPEFDYHESFRVLSWIPYQKDLSSALVFLKGAKVLSFGQT